MARTQRERREATVARLLDAGIATIVEVGYARASAKTIAERAGVSDGALFRHFDTMGDFMAATAREVLHRQLDLFAKRVSEIPDDGPAVGAVLTVLRDITRSPTNAVLYELMIAARTDALLRATLRDVLEEYSTKIYETARVLPGADDVPDEIFPAVVATMTTSFDGAAMVRAVLPQPDLDEQQVPVLMALLQSVTAG
ncbi:MAG TPA: TetR/AcrR family transcriptional regulator [Mycobacterium sp.]